MNTQAGWHHEIFGDGERHSYKILRELFHGRTHYQDMAIYDLAELRATLVLDPKIQAAEADEHIRYEALLHPGLLAHGTQGVSSLPGAGMVPLCTKCCVIDPCGPRINSGVRAPASNRGLGMTQRAADESCNQTRVLPYGRPSACKATLGFLTGLLLCLRSTAPQAQAGRIRHLGWPLLVASPLHANPQAAVFLNVANVSEIR
jgi:hypothetical protein